MSAWATTIISGLVLVVAFMQWRTAHQKVVLDLFDRRFSIYTQMRSIVDDAVLYHGAIDKDLLARIHRVRQDAAFLFGEEVVSQIWELEKALMKIEVNAVLEQGAKAMGIERGFGDVVFVASARAQAAMILEEIPRLMTSYMRMDQKLVRTPIEWIRDRNAARLSYADEKQK